MEQWRLVFILLNYQTINIFIKTQHTAVINDKSPSSK